MALRGIPAHVRVVFVITYEKFFFMILILTSKVLLVILWKNALVE